MKEEHTNYKVMQQLFPNNQPRMNLATLMQNDTQWPVKGNGYGIILPQQIDDCDLDCTTVPAKQQSVNLQLFDLYIYIYKLFSMLTMNCIYAIEK